MYKSRIRLMDSLHRGHTPARIRSLSGVTRQVKDPSSEQIIEAATTNPTAGADVKVFRKKYSDLDEAIASLAFKRRQSQLQAKFPEIDIKRASTDELNVLLEKIQAERLTLANLPSSLA